VNLRVALVHPFHWADVARGGERYVADLAWWLSKRGHEVDVITGTDGGRDVRTEDGATIRRVPHLLPRRLRRRGVSAVDTFGLPAFPALLRHRYDVVHAMVPAAAIASRLAGQRTLLTALGHPTPEQFGHRPFDRSLARTGIAMAHLTAAFSEASAAQVRMMFNTECVVLPLGVRQADFAPRLDARTGPPRLLFAGFPGAERKGIDVALRALPRVLDEFPDARLVVPGERHHHEWAHASLGADLDRVLGAVDDVGVQPMHAMPKLFRSATVSLLPARWEALGIAVVESLACGTPAVCADDGGTPGILSDPQVGVVVPYGDPTGLAAGLAAAIRLARDPRTPARCVEHATRWDWDRSVGPMHEATYRRLSRAVRSSGPSPK
jgi:phosphatidylinositol alpha-mannosyltransferase